MDLNKVWARDASRLTLRIGHLIGPDVLAHDVILTLEEGHATRWALTQHSAPTMVDVHLPHLALVPGLVNAHSHAFQRTFRGHTEYLNLEHPEDDFWSWRTQMYEVANTLTPEHMYERAVEVYEEMAATGITHVGEFHYVHHQPGGEPYAEPNLMAHQLIRAAREVGIRITLLRVVYQRGGFNQTPHPHQRRFIDEDIDDALAAIDALYNTYADASDVVIGVAPHSVRAVGQESLTRLARFTRDRAMPLHIHACEQRAEVAQSIRAHGKTPIELLHEAQVLGPHTTLIHATHLSTRDVELIAQTNTLVCACPSTERNLGDGFLPALELLKRRVRVCLGSDSHANIDLWDEMRLVEYHERLRYERRNVLAEAYGAWHSHEPQRYATADMLWPMAHAHGEQSLTMVPGTTQQVVPGTIEDFCLVDMTHWSVRGARADALLSALAFSLKPGAIQATLVAGRLTRPFRRDDYRG